MNDEKIQKISDLLISKSKGLFNSSNNFLTSSEKSVYVKLSEEQFCFFSELVSVLNGKYVKNEIENQLVNKGYSRETVDRGIKYLYDKGLLVNSVQSTTSKVEIEMSSKKIFEIDFKRLSNSMIECINFINHLLIIWTYFGILFFLVNINTTIDIFVDSFFGTQNFFQSTHLLLDMLIILVIGIFSTIFHELGHIIVSYYNNVQPKSISLSLKLGVMPIFYVKYEEFYISSSVTKLKILFGGMWINLLLVFTAMFISFYVDNWILSAVIMINVGLIFSCLNPIVSSDGYFIIAVLFNIEGFRWKMLKLISLLINKTITLADFCSWKHLKYLICFVVSYGVSFFSLYSMGKIIIAYFHIGISFKLLSLVTVIVIVISFLKNLKEFYNNLKKM